jgi:hypothetical protein
LALVEGAADDRHALAEVANEAATARWDALIEIESGE